MKALAINGWARVFEPNLTKDARCGLMLPMKRGTGSMKIRNLENGAAVYGVWIALLQVAMECVPRGTLIYTDKDVKAHDDESLALVTAFQRRDVAAAISALLDVGWLEWVEIPDGKPQKISAPPLEDFLAEVGARMVYDGKSLLDEWQKAVKGMVPSAVRKVFKNAVPGISYPREFIKARKEMGL